MAVRVTVEVSEEVAAALEALARSADTSVEQRGGELLTEAIWEGHEGLVPNAIPPAARMANALLSNAIDAGAEEMRLMPVPGGGMRTVMHRPGTERYEPVGDPASQPFPPHVRWMIFDRFEKMAAGRYLRHLLGQEERRFPVIHDGRPVECFLRYVPDPEADGGESLRLRFAYPPPAAAESSGSRP